METGGRKMEELLADVPHKDRDLGPSPGEFLKFKERISRLFLFCATAELG